MSEDLSALGFTSRLGRLGMGGSSSRERVSFSSGTFSSVGAITGDCSNFLGIEIRTCAAAATISGFTATSSNLNASRGHFLVWRNTG